MAERLTARQIQARIVGTAQGAELTGRLLEPPSSRRVGDDPAASAAIRRTHGGLAPTRAQREARSQAESAAADAAMTDAAADALAAKARELADEYGVDFDTALSMLADDEREAA